MKESNSADKQVLIFIVALALAIGALTLRGFVLSQLWQWFLVEPFMLPKLSVMHSIGIAIFASNMSLKLPAKEDSDHFKIIVTLFVTPLTSLAVAWAVKQLM